MNEITKYVVAGKGKKVYCDRIRDALVCAKEYDSPTVICATWKSSQDYLSKEEPISKKVVVKRDAA